MNRREAMQSLVAAATARWTAEGWNPQEMEDWEPVTSGIYGYERWGFEATEMSGHVNGPITHAEIDEFSSREIRVAYTEKGVWLDVDGKVEEITVGALATLSPEQAKDIAVALYQAAEELERRGSEA